MSIKTVVPVVIALLATTSCAHNAPTVAPPTAAPPMDYANLVFFDWDSAVLNERARQSIAESAARGHRAGFRFPFIFGHADRSGPAAYNQRLSERRAEAVPLNSNAWASAATTCRL